MDPEVPRPPVRAIPSLPATLTPAEERIIPYLCAGWSDVAIAHDLGLTGDAVRQAVAGCRVKFNCSSRALLVARLRQGEGIP